MERVAVIGVGLTKIESGKRETFAELVWEAAQKALKDADMTVKDIDNVVSVSSDFWDGRTISSMAISDASGAYNKDISTVEGDGTFGVLYGMMRILSGSFGTTMVVAHHKGSESSMTGITNTSFDPLVERKLGLDAITSAALQARRYMTVSGGTEEQFAMVSVKNHKNAMNNPYAQIAMDITVEDVMNSKMMSTPIKKLDCCPIGDGAAAVVLAAERNAKKLTTNKKRVWLNGVGHCTDAYRLGDRDLADTKALTVAAKKAYDMAGVTVDDIDLAEVYDAFSYMEPLWLEGMGFCDKCAGPEMVERNKFVMGSKLPVNPSGGRISANPVQVAGMMAMIDAVWQLRGEAGKRQVKGAETALVHGINGMCGQSHCVWILGK